MFSRSPSHLRLDPEGESQTHLVLVLPHHQAPEAQLGGVGEHSPRGMRKLLGPKQV